MSTFKRLLSLAALLGAFVLVPLTASADGGHGRGAGRGRGGHDNRGQVHRGERRRLARNIHEDSG